MSIERKSIWTVRVINEYCVCFFPKMIYKFMERLLHAEFVYYLWSKSMGWFLYDNGLRHEMVK